MSTGTVFPAFASSEHIQTGSLWQAEVDITAS
jgi:hypothetical protein